MFVNTSLFTFTFLAALGAVIAPYPGAAQHKWWYQDAFNPGAAQDNWWYQDGFGGQSSSFGSNPYYNAYQQMRRQIDAYGYATHVGLINRGHLSDPDLYSPRDRAFGYQSDFNPGDSVSGALNFVPKKQKVRATDGMIRAGFADKVGELISLPNNVKVKHDGTVLVQTSANTKHPCDPNPCQRYTLNKVCSVVNKHTVKCSGVSQVSVAVEWGLTGADVNLDIVLRPAYRNGTTCDLNPSSDYPDFLIPESVTFDDTHEGCGGDVSRNEYYSGSTGRRVTEYTLFKTMDDGVDFRDLTYFVGVVSWEMIGLADEKVVFKVKIGDKVVQTFMVPADDGVVDPAYHEYSSYDDYYYYGDAYLFFVGCFRPDKGYIDTRGAGFYSPVKEVYDGSFWWSPDLCKKLLNHPGPSGVDPSLLPFENSNDY